VPRREIKLEEDRPVRRVGTPAPGVASDDRASQRAADQKVVQPPTILTLGVANRYKWLTRLLTCYITSYRRPQTLLLITA